MQSVSEQNRYYFLDALRGIAAFLVFLFHIHNANYFVMDGLWLAVDLFFVLSGFVLFPELSKIEDSKLARVFMLKRIIRLSPLPILTIIFMSLRQHNSTFQSIKFVEVSSFTAVISSILFLQVFSSQAVAVNLTLWSLSAEFWTNFLASILHSRKMIYIMISISSTLVTISILLSFPKEYGLLAISRTCLGFYIGMFLRKKSNRFIFNNKRLLFSVLLLLPLLHFGGQSTFSILFAIPIFSIIIVDLSKISQESISGRTKNFCIFLGRNSYGIYVWQVPVNSLVQSRNIEQFLNLNPSSYNTFFIVVTLKFVALLLISELTTRFYEAPFQRVLKKTFSRRG
jgi:peptidoglycan/LPS O-acetylase OafA/YrhL